MSSIVIRELAPGTELDRRAMIAVRGGANYPANGYGPIASINVSPTIQQNIQQIQVVNVAALNNIGYIGAGFGPLNLKVDPSQYASTGVTL
ncbi:hypothetical protein [Paraburkholderia tagetis]|uniref:Uncharacterized protein n=1 Tax=Paraburkholderia tagetis TaxID=2913261 RepID=A0A9X1RMW9_9BURK|nr:hypothetical protein [Paraburkholderia tagetis]MCG5072726.1 hypothetical protein [Paraburkholderia tagetis]